MWTNKSLPQSNHRRTSNHVHTLVSSYHLTNIFLPSRINKMLLCRNKEQKIIAVARWLLTFEILDHNNYTGIYKLNCDGRSDVSRQLSYYKQYAQTMLQRVYNLTSVIVDCAIINLTTVYHQLSKADLSQLKV